MNFVVVRAAHRHERVIHLVTERERLLGEAKRHATI
jgi:hypothetical protein